MINSDQLRLEIIRPTLMYLDSVIPYSAAAENLLMGTCAQESRMCTYIKQLGNGPACGPYQMEPNTSNDIVTNYLNFREQMHELVDTLGACPIGLKKEYADLIGNLYYATAMARVHYYRVPEPIPLSDDIQGLALYWKKYYNTYEGKGTTTEFVHNYKKYVV